MVRDVERGPYSEEGSAVGGHRLRAGWDPTDVVVDPWSGLAHKSLIGPGTRRSTASLAPSWVGMHSRRLNAYRVLAGYLANVSRAYLPSDSEFSDVVARREYGDPATLRDMVRTSVLGDEPKIMVDNAGDEPEEPTPPEDPGPDADEAARAEFDAAQSEYEQRLVEFNRDKATFDAAQQLQEWFDEWADREKFPLKLLETENDAVGLGDGVYLVSWSNKRNRVCLEMEDPGFYFPVLEPNGYEYPEKVHLAWEECENEGTRDEVRYVRRLTFELVDLDAPTWYPWQDREVDEQSTQVCQLTNARWRWDDLGDRRVDDFDLSKATIELNADGDELRDYPLGIDFIPIVHVPNTISLKQHYGESILTRVAQILDDIQATDSDLAVASDLAGAPPLALEGGARPADGRLLTYGPGTVLFGKAEVVDTSHSLDALMKRLEMLLDRLSVNSRFPAAAMGRIDPSKIEAGVILLLTFAPLRSLVYEMRMVRADKYALLFRMVQRLAMVGATGTNGETKIGRTLKAAPEQRVELKFGPYMPTDQAQIVAMVKDLVSSHLLSRQSALGILSDAGVEVDDDLADELERIEHEDFEGAAALANALGAEQPAADYLGRSLPAVQGAGRPGVALGGAPAPGATVPPGGTPTPPPPVPANGATGPQPPAR